MNGIQKPGETTLYALVQSGPLAGQYATLISCDSEGECSIDVRGSIHTESVVNLAIFSKGHPDFPNCDIHE